MARFVLFRGSVATNPPGSVSKNLTGSILKKILIVAGCVVAFAWFRLLLRRHHVAVTLPAAVTSAVGRASAQQYEGRFRGLASLLVVHMG